MPTINQLSETDEISAGDLFPIYSSGNGDARKASAAVFGEFIQAQMAAIDDKNTQYASPSATGFSVVLVDSGSSIWLILTPVANYAAGTLILPSLANSVDKQEILVNCTHAVTTLTINGNGSSVVGAPTTLAAGDFFRLRYEGVTKIWYCV
jgi:hypothetical protein